MQKNPKCLMIWVIASIFHIHSFRSKLQLLVTCLFIKNDYFQVFYHIHQELDQINHILNSIKLNNMHILRCLGTVLSNLNNKSKHFESQKSGNDNKLAQSKLIFLFFRFLAKHWEYLLPRKSINYNYLLKVSLSDISIY